MRTEGKKIYESPETDVIAVIVETGIARSYGEANHAGTDMGTVSYDID